MDIMRSAMAVEEENKLQDKDELTMLREEK